MNSRQYYKQYDCTKYYNFHAILILTTFTGLFVYFILKLGNIELEVMFVAPDEDSDEENNEFDDENGFR